jgi:Bacterial Ig-like domain (group 3)
MRLNFLNVREDVVVGQTAFVSFVLANAWDPPGLMFTVEADKSEFDASWWVVTHDDDLLTRRLEVRLPIDRGIVASEYRLRLTATDVSTGEAAVGDCVLRITRPLCVKFPKHGRRVQVHARTITVSIPIVNCGPFKFHVTLEVTRKRDGRLLIGPEDFVVDVGYRKLDATLQLPLDSGRLSARDITITVTCDGVPTTIQATQLPGLLLAITTVAVLIVVLGGIALVRSIHPSSHRSAPKTSSTVTSSTSKQTLVLSTGTHTALTADRFSASPASYTLAATVAADFGNREPAGTVAFSDQGGLLGVEPLRGSIALLTIVFQPGGYSIVATYRGSHEFSASTSPSVPLTVPRVGTSLNLTSPSGSSCDLMTFTATVNASLPGTVGPTGTVTFTPVSTGTGTSTTSATSSAPTSATASTPVTSTTVAPPTPSSTAAPLSDEGIATWEPDLAGGPYTITASYSGDPAYSPSRSPDLSYTRTCDFAIAP